MAQVLSLMETHLANRSDDSSGSQALRIKEKEVYAGSHCPSHVYTRIHRPKDMYNLEKIIFGPWYLDLCFWTIVSHPKC